MENGHDGVKNRQRHTEKSRLVQGLEALFKAAPEPPLAAGVSAALTQSKAAVQKWICPQFGWYHGAFTAFVPCRTGAFYFLRSLAAWLCRNIVELF